MIPRIIHRLWDTRGERITKSNPLMPEEFLQYGREWRELHPAWRVIDWHDTRPLWPLQKLSEDLHRDAPAQDRHRYRADLMRLEIIWRFGGVYVDTDMQPLRPIDELITGFNVLLATSANRGAGGVKVVTNAFIAAPRHDPFIGRAIERLPGAAMLFAGKPTAQSVGPWHLQRCLDGGLGPDVTVLPQDHFFPQSNKDRDRGKRVDLSKAYAWHRWSTSRGA